MTYEFEGRTEQEAIDKAIKQLEITQRQFDVEIISREQKGIFFKRSVVKIRIHLEEDIQLNIESVEISQEIINQLLSFLEKVVFLMGFEGQFSLKKVQDNKAYIQLETSNANVLIGRQGRSLDALQVLANACWMKLTEKKDDQRKVMVILDIEDYRERYEEKLLSLALQSADRVRRSRQSLLLKPMNPFERRLIHSALNDVSDVKTHSEGTGTLKRVRISYQF